MTRYRRGPPAHCFPQCRPGGPNESEQILMRSVKLQVKDKLADDFTGDVISLKPPSQQVLQVVSHSDGYSV
ncbi:hypothetical protein F2P81_009068 [Scophthalmus maximus]|uniref:Uncharacterized protein n=1 Tax=Scophthalmus maximus TaxID=52904 RepID=A0A6A4T5U8_SCOMX|nr:hypothetical protein F2P81_009068 [Scophthalmus maximus]